MAKKPIKFGDNLKLNLGCGDVILPNFINADISGKEGTVKIDLNKPLPFKDNSARYVLTSHVLEHLNNPLEVMLEIYRVCKPGAIVDIYLPHYSLCATYADLTHKYPGYSYLTFGEKFWNKTLYTKFRLIKKKLNFMRYDWRGVKCKFMNAIFNPIINLNPVVYERFFAFILPCSEIHFRLQVVK